MRIGVPREIKDHEHRVGLTPEGAAELIGHGHEVFIEARAGAGCGFADDEYEEAGASIAGAAECWDTELIIKVKEPLEPEYVFLEDQILFAYLHLAGVDTRLTHTLLEAGTTAIAMETIEDVNGRFPLLAPMSAIAGSMAPIMGAYYLARFNEGRGMLIGSLLGERYGNVVVIGDGTVGQHAARVAGALGARALVVFGKDTSRADELAGITALEYLASTPEAIAERLADADLVVGAVLVGGARAPRVVTEAMVRGMPAGSVIVDVSIDQGGCVETSRPTTHSDPVFLKHGVIHYCVTNMPGAYPRTSTLALTDASLPYVLRVADGGLDAVQTDPGFARGINVHRGEITHRAVADALDRRARERES